jgi:alginate O-acetyltransferase complex protein AlgI
MLFNSYTFLFLFLPLALIFFFSKKTFGLKNIKIKILIILSIFFYSWWDYRYLILLLCSIVLNYLISYLIINRNKKFLFLGILGNLFILGYFKYYNFFIDNYNLLFEENYNLKNIILPLGISFYIFQQIAYLVDCYLGSIKKINLEKYLLFVIFFPQIIAGPIVKYNFMVPQFNFNNKKIFNYLNVGLATFIVGLGKKVLIADNLGSYIDPYFQFIEMGYSITFFEAWFGSILYAFQLYFDFSGYSDMALGLALMFGVILPVNFFSPFKAKNISEFWSCWHITLSNLVRNYIYYPLSLSLNRICIIYNLNGFSSFILGTSIPTIIAFFCIGFWHGAGWNFIIFGLINAFYLIVFNFWTFIKNFLNISYKENIFTSLASQFLTFLSIVVALVFFRSSDFDSAIKYLKFLSGTNGIELNDIFQSGMMGASPYTGLSWLLLCSLIIFFLPNTQEGIFYKIKNNLNRSNIIKKRSSIINIKWKPNFFYLILTLVIFVLSLMSLGVGNEFIYFQF